MKFIISKTSLWDDEIAPCNGAKKEDLTYLDYRTVKTLEEARKHKGINTPKSWFAEGRNHRKETGMVVRDLERKFWTIEIDDIMEFFEKHGDLVICTSNCKEYPIEIEIYDSWRE